LLKKEKVNYLSPSQIKRRGERYSNHPGPYPIEEDDLKAIFPDIPSSAPPATTDEEFLYRSGELYFTDLEILLRLAKYLSPSIVLEIGTFTGKTTFHLAKCLPSSLIITIDLPKENIADNDQIYGTDNAYLQSINQIGAIFKNTKEEKQIVQILSDSNSVQCQMKLDEILQGRKIDFAFIDGSHSYSNVKNDFENVVLPRLSKNGIVVFDDYGLLMTHLGVTHYLLEKAYKDSFLFYWFAPDELTHSVIYLNCDEAKQHKWK
jgi:predicted O-methyltransferase YrrM